MIKIIVKHSHIEINDYNMGDSEQLEGYFSIWNQTRHCNEPFGYYYDPNTKILYLPRGIDIDYIRRIFKCNPMVDKRHDPFDYVKPFNLKYSPRENQKEPLRFMLGKKEYYYTSTKSQLCINLSPGYGKTFMSVLTAGITRVRSIMITSSLEWIAQWKNAILEYTDINPREIYIISGTPSIHILLKRDMNNYRFILGSLQTLMEYGKKYGWDQLSKLFEYMRVGIRFMDEAHLQFQSMMMLDNFSDTYKTYYLTATPYRSNDDENRIYKMYFKNIPSIDLFDENTDPHTSYTAFIYNSNPSPMDISMCRNKYGVDRNKYVGKYIITRKNFWDLTRLIIERTLATKGKILVYVAVNLTIQVLKRWMEAYYPFLIGHIGVYTSETPKSIKEGQKDKKYILSTTKSAGTAMDIKGLATTVVLAEPFKSEPLTIQSLGRTRDDNTEMIELVDKGFNGLLKFYHKKRPILNKYATELNEEKYNQLRIDNEVFESMNKFYGNGVFPKIYLENNKRPMFIRMQPFPFNEFNNKGKRKWIERMPEDDE